MDDIVMKQRSIVRYERNGAQQMDSESVHQCKTMEDHIATEHPLTMMLDGEEFGTMLCSPTHLEELVIGFLAAEGLIRVPNEIADLSIDEGKGFAHVSLKTKRKEGMSPIQASTSKRVIGSCCGKSRQFYFSSDVKTAKTIQTETTITVDQVFRLMEKMQRESAEFQLTGGLHNASLCRVTDAGQTEQNNTGEVIVSRSDIGRHNALDKIYGYCLQNKIPLKDTIITFSGRISSEVLLKVAKIGVGIILSKSAPTTLAIDLAEDLGITTVGFIRGDRMNVYSYPQRIIADS